MLFFRFCRKLLIATIFLFGGVSATLSQTQQEQSILDAIDNIQKVRLAGNLVHADKLTLELLRTVEAKDDILSRGDLYVEQARNAIEHNKLDDSVAFLQQAIAIFTQLNNTRKLGIAQLELGYTFSEKHEYPQALKYAYSALNLLKDTDDKPAMASANNYLGIILEAMNRVDEAIGHHKQSLIINTELQNDDNIASDLYNLAQISSNMGDHRHALQYFLDVLAIDVKSGFTKNIGFSRTKVGYEYLQLGEIDKAESNIQEALKLFKKIESGVNIRWANANLASVYLAQGKLDEAEQLIGEVIEESEQSLHDKVLSAAYLTAARIAIAQDKYQHALDLIATGIELDIAKHNITNQATLEQLRAQVYVHLQDYKRAYQSLYERMKLEKEWLDESRNQTIAQLQAEAEFVRQTSEINQLQAEKSLLVAQEEKDRLALKLWLVGASFPVIMLFLFFYRRTQGMLRANLRRKVESRTNELNDKNAELKLAYKKMETLSLTDKLTGLHNRRFFEQHIEADLITSNRNCEDLKNGRISALDKNDIVVFVIDIDHFKSVNDNHGHDAGDIALQQVTNRLQHVFRASDYIVRWGGEEFVAVARFIDRKDASALAQRIVNELAQTPFDITQGDPITLTCSVGFACYPLQANDHGHWGELFSLADSCLYYVKQHGRNNWLGVESATLNEDSLINSDTLIQWDTQGLLKLVRPRDGKIQ